MWTLRVGRGKGTCEAPSPAPPQVLKTPRVAHGCEAFQSLRYVSTDTVHRSMPGEDMLTPQLPHPLPRKLSPSYPRTWALTVRSYPTRAVTDGLAGDAASDERAPFLRVAAPRKGDEAASPSGLGGGASFGGRGGFVGAPFRWMAWGVGVLVRSGLARQVGSPPLPLTILPLQILPLQIIPILRLTGNCSSSSQCHELFSPLDGGTACAAVSPPVRARCVARLPSRVSLSAFSLLFPFGTEVIHQRRSPRSYILGTVPCGFKLRKRYTVRRGNGGCPVVTEL